MPKGGVGGLPGFTGIGEGVDESMWGFNRRRDR
jgi:hypothetical protein